ncbi:GH1 family beta-glucosidase [Anaerocolumna jejuensis]|uniref:GH1 family beta-glucosidase n=1 Tax=Anaerocolumna jejuensis TaxID=259063 RepID=UPI003F7C87E8
MKKIEFPADFIFGTATSAAQLEGASLEDGKGLSIWDVFARIPGAIADGTTPDIACDMYRSYEEDLKLAGKLNMESFRFSFSWSRILPEGRGRVNQKGLDYYKRLIDSIHQNGMVPNATIYHWDLPYELEREGGWLNREVVKWYGEYASLLFDTFGENIPLWATVNEPIATYVGYALGQFAPGRRSESFGRQANHHLLLAHGEGVKRFREAGLKNSRIGMVVDIWHHHPLRAGSKEDRELAELENEKTYRSYLNPVFQGCYSERLLEYMKENNCMPVMEEEDMERIKQPLDYFGLNCYNRVLSCAESELLKPRKKNGQGGNFLENGSEFYPKAVYDAIGILNREYKIGIPIYITENGTYNCSEEVTAKGKVHDTQRIRYIQGFLYWIHKAMEEGADIRGYYLWSLLDNWEWSAGYTYRFGLVHTDFKTQERIVKDSALWFKEMVKNRGFVPEDEYTEE